MLRHGDHSSVLALGWIEETEVSFESFGKIGFGHEVTRWGRTAQRASFVEPKAREYKKAALTCKQKAQC